MRQGIVVFTLILLLAAPGAAFAQRSPLLFGQQPRSQQGGDTASWQQWDAFLTFVITRLGQTIPREGQDRLAELLLNARYELVDALISPTVRAEDIVPSLFFSTIQQLTPALRNSLAGVPSDKASQIANFANAADAMNAVGAMGFRMGLVKLTPNTLRSLAHVLEPQADADPIAYGTAIDTSLRNLLGFGAPIREPIYDPFQRLLPPSGERRQETPSSRLNTWIPHHDDINEYLRTVRELLAGLAEKNLANASMSEQFEELYGDLVLATAWQESCWRQFVRSGKKLQPLTSGTGDVGLMQINRIVWRGVYDLNRLEHDIRYNGRAGSEILLNYLTRYAIRRGEHRRPGGIDNLARATYGAYNGGPRHLTRYRRPTTNPNLKRVDDLFWAKYAQVKSGNELQVRQCYGF